MKSHRSSKHVSALFLVAAAAIALPSAKAADLDHGRSAGLGEHPAVLAARQVQGIDPNHFIVGHPAGGAYQASGIPGVDHPAVLVARHHVAAIDPNHFILAHPAGGATSIH